MNRQVIIDTENSADVRVQKANHLAQFFQTLCMLCLTLVVGGFILLQNRWWLTLWTVVFLAGAAASFVSAILQGLKAVKTYCSTRFEINNQRLSTLSAINMPADVMNAMWKFNRGKYTGEGRFFHVLSSAIGSERCSEFRNPIFKYTKLD